MRLIFMGTPAFAVPTLQALIGSQHDVVAVYTQPPRPAHRGQKETPSPVHVLAGEHNIPVHIPTSLKGEDEQTIFAKYHADCAVVAAYGMLLPVPILQAPRLGCINVHPSKLPRWRGAAPLQRTIMAGDKETAICIMQMAEGLDTGDILLQKDYAVSDGTTSGELHDLLAKEAGPLVLQTLQESLTPHPQSAEGVTYAKKITKEEALIDWSKSADEILHVIHGLNPAPGAYFLHNGERIKLWKAALFPSPVGGGSRWGHGGHGANQAPLPASPLLVEEPPGTLLPNPFRITCAGGSILPTLLQREGKKAMLVEEFLKGFSL